MEQLASIFETLMIVSFGISWPVNVTKAIRARSTKGKSIMFDYFIFAGYICGIVSKIMTHTFNLAFWFYFPNIIMVGLDIIVYYRNRKLEKAAAEK